MKKIISLGIMVVILSGCNAIESSKEEPKVKEDSTVKETLIKSKILNISAEMKEDLMREDADEYEGTWHYCVHDPKSGNTYFYSRGNQLLGARTDKKQ